MRSFRAACYSLCAVLSFALSGCNGSGSIPESAALQSSVQKATSSGASYIYAADHGETYVLTYPDGQFVAKVNNWGWMCSDPNNGDVYITNGADLSQYLPGGTTRIGLVTVSTDEELGGCSVSPVNGNLAVIATQRFALHHVQHTWLTVFGTRHGLSKLARILVPRLSAGSTEFCGYDNRGNLFADGVNVKTDAVGLAELQKNAKHFVDISVDHLTAWGPVQWDGNYITVEDENNPAIYRISVSGSTGTVVGSTRLRHPSGTKGEKFAATWIQGDTVLAGTNLGTGKDNGIGLWDYPRGHQPYKVLNYFGHRHGHVLYVVVSAPGR